jgi:hypothetical protein
MSVVIFIVGAVDVAVPVMAHPQIMIISPEKTATIAFRVELLNLFAACSMVYLLPMGMA